MSGFCGWFGAGGEKDAPDRLLQEMAGALPHYGPNDHWVGHKPNGGLAMAASAKLGAFLSNGRFLAAIEGYPYWSHEDLQKIAREQGHANALVEAFRRYDIGLFDYLHGPFSFALWDHENSDGVAAIDRLGIQPLCYAAVADGLVLGSTTDSVRVHPAVGSPLSPQGVFNYLYFYRVPCPGTIFLNQHKLKPANYVRYRNGAAQVACYWQMPYGEASTASFDDLKDELHVLLRQAMKRCLSDEDDAVSGAFLSGGLDSSTVLGLLAEQRPGRSPAFTIGFDVEGYDESHFARVAASYFESEHKEYSLTPDDVVELVPKLAQIYDEPMGNASVVPSYFCADQARQAGVMLLMAGDGGDELFAGNSRYTELQVYEKYQRLPAFVRKGLIEPAVGLLGSLTSARLVRRARNYLYDANRPLYELIERYNLLADEPAGAVMHADFVNQVDADDPMEIFRERYEAMPNVGTVQKLMLLDQQVTLADNDIRKVSRMCELAGIRVRYPLLDEDLAIFSATIPAEMHLRGGRLRDFYKRSLQDFLPGEVINKSKHGFGMPTEIWMKNDARLRDMCREALRSLKRRNLLNDDYVDPVIADLEKSERTRYSGATWDLMILEQWMATRGL
jgi:asparagine synthase (glutamine-hydrolysing)